MRKSPVLIAALLGSIGWAAHAQSQNDLSGTWNLTANATFGPAKGEVVDCQFTGQAQIMMETSSTFGGQAALTLSGGSQRCPAEMDADVDGTVANGVVQMSMLMGPLGTAQFRLSSCGEAAFSFDAPGLLGRNTLDFSRLATTEGLFCADR